MDFACSDRQQALRDSVAEFARKSLASDMIEMDRSHVFARDAWSKCADFGIQGLPIPEQYGGTGEDALTTVLAMETLGNGCRDNGLLFGIAAQMWSVQMPILHFGTEAQRARYLPRLCSGEWIGAHGMSEPDAGSDAFSLRTVATRDGDEYVLHGTKTFVSNAPVADCYVIFATVDRSLGALGITGFLVDRETPGLSVGRPIEKMGLRTSPMAQIHLDECRVPTDCRLGREGRGARIFNDSMEWERACILATALGAMQRQLDTCIRYAHERHQFGRAIGNHQLVSSRLVNMAMRIETGRHLLYKAVWLKQARQPADTAAAMAKLHISEGWIQSSLDAVQIHGGYGFTTEYELERELRDSIGSTLYSGTSEIQRAIIARSFGFGR